MTVEQTEIIDGIGFDKAQSGVVMLISDHLEWGDARHLQVLALKVEAYANAVLSGQLTEWNPEAIEKPVSIQLVTAHEPDAAARRFFESLQAQLQPIGITFSQGPLPDGY